MLAVNRIARRDLLVGLHLALDLVRECSVMAMILRDQQTGITHHRFGHDDQSYLSQLAGTVQPYTAEGRLASIEACAIAYDSFASQLTADYIPRRFPLLRWIERVRDSI